MNENATPEWINIICAKQLVENSAWKILVRRNITPKSGWRLTMGLNVHIQRERDMKS